jgi:hypothetical protein
MNERVDLYLEEWICILEVIAPTPLSIVLVPFSVWVSVGDGFKKMFLLIKRLKIVGGLEPGL